MICDNCKIDFEMWMTTNEEWNKVIKEKDKYSNLCIDCFKEEAQKQNIIIDTNKIEIYNKQNPYV